MSKAAYWQRGESLDYKNTTENIIEANSVIALTGRIGVAGTSINPGEVGSLNVTGVFEFEKTGTAAVKMGQTVYFDGEGITDTAADNTAAGYAAQDAGEDDATILVKLQG